MTSRPHALHLEPLSSSSEWRTVRIKRRWGFFFVFPPAERECIFFSSFWDVSFKHVWRTSKVEFVPLLSWTDSFRVLLWFAAKFFVRKPTGGSCAGSDTPAAACATEGRTNGGVDGSRVKWRWSAISASLRVSLVCLIVRNSGGSARRGCSLLDSAGELGISLLDLRDASALELASCATRRSAELSDKFAWHFHLIPENISFNLWHQISYSAMILTTFVIILSFPGKWRIHLLNFYV